MEMTSRPRWRADCSAETAGATDEHRVPDLLWRLGRDRHTTWYDRVADYTTADFQTPLPPPGQGLDVVHPNESGRHANPDGRRRCLRQAVPGRVPVRSSPTIATYRWPLNQSRPTTRGAAVDRRGVDDRHEQMTAMQALETAERVGGWPWPSDAAGLGFWEWLVRRRRDRPDLSDAQRARASMGRPGLDTPCRRRLAVPEPASIPTTGTGYATTMADVVTRAAGRGRLPLRVPRRPRPDGSVRPGVQADGRPGLRRRRQVPPGTRG